MPWADRYIEGLLAGNTVSFRPQGGSMRGRIESGQLVTVEPLSRELKVDDVVLCRVAGSQYLHLVKATRGKGEDRQFLIGNNRGGTNGWIGKQTVYGILSKIEEDL
jgi:hypothetical protein